MNTIKNTPAFPFAEKHNIIIPDANNREHIIMVNFPPEEWITYLKGDDKLIGSKLLKPNPYNLAHLACLNIEPNEWGKCSGLPGQMFTTEKAKDNPATGILTFGTLYSAMEILFLAAFDEELMICPGALRGSYNLAEVECNGVVTMIIDMCEEWWDIETTKMENSTPPVIANPTRLDMLHFVNTVSIKVDFPFEFSISIIPSPDKSLTARCRFWNS